LASAMWCRSSPMVRLLPATPGCSTAVDARCGGCRRRWWPAVHATLQPRGGERFWCRFRSVSRVGYRSLEVGCPALILGPSESVNPHLAAALGHIAIRRRKSVHVSRADNLFTRLRAALRTTPWPPRCRLARVQVLILDDFALRPLNPTETSDFYELVVERYGKASTILTPNREPAEWMCLMSDALLQSAVDRLSRRPRPAVDGGPRRGGIGQDPQVSVAVFGRPQFVPSQRPGSTRCRGPNRKSPTAAAQHR